MKQKTEMTLCAAFLKLLKKYPFSRITIQKIAEQSGVNRQTFYYHFDNIYDLMAKTLEYELARQKTGSEGGNVEEELLMLLRWLKQNQAVVKNILTNVEVRYITSSFYPIIARCVESINVRKMPLVYRNASVTEEEAEEFVKRFLMFGLGQYVLEWAENGFKEEPERMVEKIRMIVG